MKTSASWPGKSMARKPKGKAGGIWAMTGDEHYVEHAP
ncbi:hypothetical protein ACVWY0_002567 [Arthrobacter sp. UYNi723]